MIHSKKENIISHLHYISGDWYTKRMAFNKTFEYTAAVRGYHYFKTIWQPKENEVLICQFHNGSSYDMFDIKTCDQRGTMADHLPREASRITKFIIDRGAIVSVMLTGTHYRRSPLVKDRLEIPCKVSVSLRGTCLNLLLLERYKQLSEELYIEPKEETVLGSFLTPVQESEGQNAKSRKSQNNVGKKRNPNQQSPSSNDIRNYSGARQRIMDNGNNRRENDKEPCIILID